MTEEDDLATRARGIGALAEPVRRALYRYVVAQAEPVSRDAVASGLGVARHTAKFHLDRLVTDGLLEARFQRLTGRTGPGAGRPAKLYSRAAREVAVSLPERRYELAGAVMAAAIEQAARSDVPVLEALREAAARRGEALAADRWPGDDTAGVVDRARQLLADQGYEPRVVGHELVLMNCPFHALVAEHPEMVCHLNLALLGAVADAVHGEGDGGALTARLDPRPGRCCVVMSAT